MKPEFGQYTRVLCAEEASPMSPFAVAVRNANPLLPYQAQRRAVPSPLSVCTDLAIHIHNHGASRIISTVSCVASALLRISNSAASDYP